MKWRKPLSLALSAALSLSLAVPALAADETPAPWYAEAQAYVTDKGYMTGTDKGFEPDGTVDRATVFQTLYNLEGKPTEGIEKAAFNDIEGKWFAPAAHWAGFTGVAAGDENGAFNGERAITRAEIATILARYAAGKGLTSTEGGMSMKEAPDYDAIPAWALEGMSFCYYAGLMTGDQNGNLNPTANAVRAELATVLMKFDALTPGYVEKTVTYQSGERTVPAVVTLPAGEGPFPAVVMNHGHGGSKDENVGFVGVARALAQAGFATIRMDFPGCGGSEASFQDNTMTNMIADSNAGLAYLLDNYPIDADRLGILGYSMGGRIASEIVGAENNPYKAVVLLSAAAVDAEVLAPSIFGDLETYNELKATAEKDGFAAFTTIYGQTQELSKAWFADMEAGKPLESLAKFTGPVLVLHGDQDVVVTDEMNKAIVSAYPAAQEIVVPDADHGYGFYSDQPEVTALVETSITDFFTNNLYTTVTLEDYLAASEHDWFLTGKTEYTIQGMMVSKDTPYENVLEGNSGVVTDDGVTVLLKGTVDELWPSKLEKVEKTYTTADGSAVTAKTFAKKDTYIDLKTKAEPDTNFAMFVPADTRVVVETAWGDVLVANRPGVEHGQGDYLVSTVKDGKPDLTDVWVLNGAVFPSTYDLSRRPVTGTVTEVEKYGHAVLDVKISDFEALGFTLGDVVTVTAGDYTADMPYLDGYYVDSGEAMLRAYPGKDYLAVCINYGKFNEVAKVDVGSEITVTMKEKGGAAALQATYSLKYTNDRSDYATDEIFANFRPVVMGDIAEGKLYRSASPVNDENSRAATADKLIEAAGVKAVMNLADTDEEMAEYIAAEGFASPYYKSLVEAQAVIALGMPVNYASDEFGEGIVKGLTFLAQHDGPYLVHCTEGKDRAGFTSALLEALMGAKLEDIVADYMTSYVNYYHIDPTADKDKYDLIAEGNVMEMLRAVAGLEKGADLSKTDLAKAAESYLTAHGMKAEDLAALKANLSK
ncbi:hypothetical protein CE91St43_04890 [Oscillospiraceae bacterium]|nr:hypothetical protein CE91St43_04890 [Oscillospiraceae bacterium]